MALIFDREDDGRWIVVDARVEAEVDLPAVAHAVRVGVDGVPLAARKRQRPAAGPHIGATAVRIEGVHETAVGHGRAGTRAEDDSVSWGW